MFSQWWILRDASILSLILCDALYVLPHALRVTGNKTTLYLIVALSATGAPLDRLVLEPLLLRLSLA